MSGIDGLSGAGDTARLAARGPAGGAAEAADGAAPVFQPDGYTRVRRRTAADAARKPSASQPLAMTLVGGVLAVGALALFGSLFFGAPLLGGATLFVGPALAGLALPLLGLGVTRLLAQREAAKVGAG